MKKIILEKFRANAINTKALKSIIGGSFGCQWGDAAVAWCSGQSSCTQVGNSYCCSGTTNCSMYA